MRHIPNNAPLSLTVNSDGQHHRFGTAGWGALVNFCYSVLPPVI
ncbi:hypothetical protein [Streptomyces sp. H39-S7]|nr:hypothetical protein [Streptomyces sp. H39-S7]MCZ4120338.1 hypothetical protein [Streptomyces sp. H39-S7]